MCLRKVHKRTEKLTEGYKVFVWNQNMSELFGPYYQANKGSGYRKGRWYQAGSGNVLHWINCHEKFYYPAGFHFYKRLSSAMRRKLPVILGACAVVARVKVRDMRASGTERGRVVGVAGEMIIKEIIE